MNKKSHDHGSLMLLLFTRCATSNASRHFKSPLAMGRDAFKSKHASSVSISGVIDTGVNSNVLSSMLFQKIYKETAQTESTSLPVNYSPGFSYLSYHSNFFSKYAFRSSILTLSCSIVSRSRTVTAPSSSESKSYVTQNGVPISS